jgi:hypothetical protein
LVKGYLAVLLLCVSTLVSSAPIIFETDDSIMMIDESSIKTVVFDKNRHLRTSLSITLTVKEGLTDDGKKVFGYQRHTIVDCKNKKMNILRISSLDKDAKVINVYKNTVDDSWNTAIKDSLAEKEIKAVCHYNTYEA